MPVRPGGLLFAIAGCLASCMAASPDEGAGAHFGVDPSPPILVEQGWGEWRTGSLRDWFYYASEGSQIIPYDWFLALEQAGTTEPFRDPAHMQAMGFLVDAPGPSNPDGLPVGFARDVDPATGPWVGLTCAACHTGQLEHMGKRIRVDGGQGLVRMDLFQQRLTESLEATLADAEKLERFFGRVGGADRTDRETVIARLSEQTRYHRGRTERNRPPHSPGFGRLDGIHEPINELACDFFGKPENCLAPMAPTTPHQLWLSTRYDWVQSSATAHVPLYRNVGQAMGTYGRLSGALDSTIRIQNLHQLEKTVHELRPPRWPEDVLGPIDRAAASRGERTYWLRCVGCHALPTGGEYFPQTEPNRFGRRFIQVTQVPMSEVGTDPTFITSMATRQANVTGLPFPFEEEWVNANVLRAAAILRTTERLIGTLEYDRDQFNGRDPATRNPNREHYKANPLPGIALAPPYLHNGSVRTLHDLLLPCPSLDDCQREPAFDTGSRQYDPVHLGYFSEPVPGAETLVTTRPGDLNIGHSGPEYGTDLDEPARMDLLEFLKTL